jgi:hypothetical protein
LLTAVLSGTAGADSKNGAFKGKRAYVYFHEKTLTWRIGNDSVERVIHFDRARGTLTTLKVEAKGGGPRLAAANTHEAEWTLETPAGAKLPSKVRLEGDWVYNIQSVATPAHGGRLLTIHLHGVRRYEGLAAEVMYEVLPGNRPYLAKWVTLINRSETPFTVKEVVYDRWMMPAQPGSRTAPATYTPGAGASGALTIPVKNVGFQAGVQHEKGEAVFVNGSVTLRLKETAAVAAGGRAFTPRSLLTVFANDPSRGAALVQRFNGELQAVADSMLLHPR